MLYGAGIPNISVNNVISWTDPQIIFQLPSGIPAGSYAAQVYTSTGASSSPLIWFTVGILKITPTLDYPRFNPNAPMGAMFAFSLPGPSNTLVDWSRVYGSALTLAPQVGSSLFQMGELASTSPAMR